MKHIQIHDITSTISEEEREVASTQIQEHIASKISFYATFPVRQDENIMVDILHVAGVITAYDADRRVYYCDLSNTPYGRIIDTQPNIHYTGVMVGSHDTHDPSSIRITQIRILHAIGDNEVAALDSDS